MADIFISYKREDRRAAERLSIALEQLGFDVWWDFELLSGDRYRNVIRAVIDQCKAAIVLWSPQAIQSDFVMDEASYAKDQGKLCPARIEQIELPFGFGQIHTDDLSDWDGELSHHGFASLVRAVEAHVGRKGKFGAPARSEQSQAMTAELEAFKAAEVANNTTALKDFLREHPGGAFSNFVREQLVTMETAATKAGAFVGEAFAAFQGALKQRNVGATPPAPAATPLSASPSSRASKRRPLRKILGSLIGVGAFAVLGAGLLVGGAAVFQAIQNSRYSAAYDSGTGTDTSTMSSTDSMPSTDISTSATDTGTPASTDTSTPAETTVATSSTTFAAYDLAQLNPQVANAVQRARQEEALADAAASRARDAAQQAEAAAQAARNHQAGYHVFDVPHDDQHRHYEGGWSNGKPDGYGALTFSTGDQAGDFYEGQWRNGNPLGAGVNTFAINNDNPNSTDDPPRLRSDGEEHEDGTAIGDMYWRDGAHYSGDWRGGDMSDAGVLYEPNGRRYEGEWANSQPDRYGVLWDAQGHVIQQGVWNNGALTVPLTR